MAAVSSSAELSSPACAAAPATQRISMKVLLLANTGQEPSILAWRVALRREGVPFDVILAATRRAPIAASRLSSRLAEGMQLAHYQAIVVATDGLGDRATYAHSDGFERSEWQAIEEYERAFNIRRLIAYVHPSASYGLDPPFAAGALDGIQGTLTAEGRTVFPYLKGQVPFDTGTYGYLASPSSPANFQTLLRGPNGSALLGVHTRADGVQEMVQTFDANHSQLHSQLLRHGQLNWLTRGVRFGEQRNYLGIHVDDVLLGNHGWNTAAHATDRDRGATIRMSAADAARAAQWSTRAGVRLDLLFNGAGSERYVAERSEDGADPLLEELRRRKASFGWVNHTYRHSNLSAESATRWHIGFELQQNIAWARATLGLSCEASPVSRYGAIDPSEVVTGEHSGLAELPPGEPCASELASPQNPNLLGAFADSAIESFGVDASRPYPSDPLDAASARHAAGATFTNGEAQAIPRYPTSLFHDVCTEAQEVDEYNTLYGPVRSKDGRSGDSGSPGSGACASPPLALADILDGVVAQMFEHMMGNDPRPHYFHQANLAGDRLLLAVLDRLLARYHAHFVVPIRQPGMSEAGRLLARQRAWSSASSVQASVVQASSVQASSAQSSAVQASSVQASGYIQGDRVTVQNHGLSSLEVPLTGACIGEHYGDMASGWVTVMPGSSTFTACSTWPSASPLRGLRRKRSRR
jgi:hypothetical protein